MAVATSRDRGRPGTGDDIRAQARTLLVADGSQAVTLRAIARGLGITAPALYRYYASRDDLLEHLRQDVCRDLAVEIEDALATPADTPREERVAILCRRFRAWALAHPQEFTLVFTSPGGARRDADSIGGIFLAIAGRMLNHGVPAEPAWPRQPEALHTDLTRFHAELVDTVARQPADSPAPTIGVGTAYAVLHFWVRLYGLVALEVFGQFPFVVSDPDALFEDALAAMLAETERH
jgi:AcrR family transcriptional regulator